MSVTTRRAKDESGSARLRSSLLWRTPRAGLFLEAQTGDCESGRLLAWPAGCRVFPLVVREYSVVRRQVVGL